MKNSILYVFLLMVVGCSSNKQIQSKEAIYFGKTACLGKCPVLDIYIYNDGTVIYKGIKNVEKNGNYTFKISKKDLQEIKDEIYKIEFDTISNEKIKRDLPKTIIKFNEKKMIFQDLKKIEAFEKLLKKLIPID